MEVGELVIALEGLLGPTSSSRVQAERASTRDRNAAIADHDARQLSGSPKERFLQVSRRDLRELLVRMRVSPGGMGRLRAGAVPRRQLSHRCFQGAYDRRKSSITPGVSTV